MPDRAIQMPKTAYGRGIFYENNFAVSNTFNSIDGINLW